MQSRSRRRIRLAALGLAAVLVAGCAGLSAAEGGSEVVVVDLPLQLAARLQGWQEDRTRSVGRGRGARGGL